MINITSSCGIQLKEEEVVDEEESVQGQEEDTSNKTVVREFDFFQEVSSNIYLYLSLSFEQKGDTIPSEGSYKLYLFKKSNSTKTTAIGTATIENNVLILTPINSLPVTNENSSCQNILNQTFTLDNYSYGNSTVWITIYSQLVCMDKSSLDIVNIKPAEDWSYSCFTNEWLTIACD